jgi:hypothetical protein
MARERPQGFSPSQTPQLLDGAWSANAPRLSELVADYKLIADLATTYGRIEELRWRVRYRTEHESGRLDGMTAPLVTELVRDVDDVLKRVQGQTHNPTIRPPSIVHQRVIGGSTTPS